MDIFEAEREWASRLPGLSLVVQLEYDDNVARAALRRIGELINLSRFDVIETAHPASLLVGLNLIASAELEQGELWRQIFESMENLEGSPRNQEQITRLHRAALKRFGLQRFEHPLGRIGEIILHAGIPVHSQRSFIQRLVREYKSVADFDAAYFCSEVRSYPIERVQAKGLDKPTWRFINQAGDVAEDFVAKCIELLDDLQDDGVRNSNGGDGLPARVIDEIERVVREIGSLKRARGVSRVAGPLIIWEADALLANLPVLPEHLHSQSMWHLDTLSFQSDLTVGRTLNGLAPEVGNFEIHDISPTLAFQAATFKDSSSVPVRRSWNLKLFDEEKPVLVFDNEGKLDQLRGPVQPGLHRVLVPKNYKGTDSRIEVDGVVQARRVDAPRGWAKSKDLASWMAFEVDLTNADLLAVFVGPDTKGALRRSVSRFRKPSVDITSKVEGVFDVSGEPILSQLPSVTVPPGNEGFDVWNYRVSGEDGRLIYDWNLVPDKGVIVPPSEISLDGQLQIVVSRGFGTGLKFRVNVVSGLEISHTGIRKLEPNGLWLEAISTTLERDGKREDLDFGPRHLDRHLNRRILSNQVIVVRPAYEYFELFNTSSRRNSLWTTPVKAHIEDLPNLQLFAALDNHKGAVLVAESADALLVKIESKESAQRLLFNLAELSETAAAKGALDLKLIWPNGRTVVAGHVYPRKMFVSAAFDQEQSELVFEFKTADAPTGLEVAFYASRAPWIKYRVAPLKMGKASVPAELRGFGEIFFTLGISNDWVESVFPEVPDRSSPNTGHFPTGEIDPFFSPDHAMAYWLETRTKTPLLEEISFERAWQAMLLGNIQSGAIVGRSEVRELAGNILAKDTNSALLSYPFQLRSDEHYLKHLFATRLVIAPPASSYSDLRTLAAKPLLALFVTSSVNQKELELLISMATEFWGLVQPGESESQDEDGLDLSSLLLWKSNLFEKQPLLFAQMPDEEFEGRFGTFQPGALFEGGTMAKIVLNLAVNAEKALDLVDERELVRAVKVLDSSKELQHSRIARLVGTRPLATPEIRKKVKENRGPRIRTLDLPAVSLRLALLARLAARGFKGAATSWIEFQMLHKQISTLEPTLVELDLSIAELYLKLWEAESNE